MPKAAASMVPPMAVLPALLPKDKTAPELAVHFYSKCEDRDVSIQNIFH
jgi:hypothetical protein